MRKLEVTREEERHGDAAVKRTEVINHRDAKNAEKLCHAWSLPSLPSLVSLCAAMVRPVRKLGGNVCFAMP